MTRAFVFPGQGSQFVGMGKDLAEAFLEARHTFEEVNDALGHNLTKIMFEGAESDLNLTENTQPALMAMSVAIMNVLTRQGGIQLSKVASHVAGHSLGEYSALTAAGSLDLADCTRLARIRGKAMQEAVPVGKGAMAAILGLDYEDVKKIAEEVSGAETCEAANDNAPGQVVVSGHKGAVEAAIALATTRGAKRAIALPVSAPFHCTLMAPAAQKMATVLAETNIRVPIVPVIANVTAQATSDPAEIRRFLVEQITGRVRWRESVLWMAEHGITEAIEIGPGKVLSGLIKRISDKIETSSVGTPEQIDALIEKLSR
jgi:[acyl-carrier-protein] S-malonyltransferase